MNVKKLRLALVGKDVSKSISGKIHTFILSKLGVECEYANYSVTMEEFDSVMRTLLGDFDGFNVTIPYKRDVMGYLSEVTGDALDFGAVNTVLTASGKGYNTDGAGFMLMLRDANIAVKNKKILYSCRSNCSCIFRPVCTFTYPVWIDRSTRICRAFCFFVF